jgi:hypothetical protein
MRSLCAIGYATRELTTSQNDFANGIIEQTAPQAAATTGVAKHSNKHIREALKYAEQRGWTIRKSSGRAHSWVVIYCSHGHRECWMSIYSTPKNPEKHAATFEKPWIVAPDDWSEVEWLHIAFH